MIIFLLLNDISNVNEDLNGLVSELLSRIVEELI